NVPFEAVTVVHSDTAAVPRGEGTMGSSSAQVGGSSILRASDGVLDKARCLAAHVLEAGTEDVVLVDDGRIGIDGAAAGGLAQGIAQALYEEVLFDDDGNPLTASLMAYEMPSAADLPSFETAHTVTPSPLNPLGAKGIGESATIGSTPAVQSAVVDALSH